MIELTPDELIRQMREALIMHCWYKGFCYNLGKHEGASEANLKYYNIKREDLIKTDQNHRFCLVKWEEWECVEYRCDVCAKDSDVIRELTPKEVFTMKIFWKG